MLLLLHLLKKNLRRIFDWCLHYKSLTNTHVCLKQNKAICLNNCSVSTSNLQQALSGCPKTLKTNVEIAKIVPLFFHLNLVFHLLLVLFHYSAGLRMICSIRELSTNSGEFGWHRSVRDTFLSSSVSIM